MRNSYWIITIIIIATAACFIRFESNVDSSNQLRMAVWGMPFEDKLFRDGFARDFEKLHDGIAVKYEKYTDVTAKYYAWHLLEEGADVMRVPITDYHALVTKGLLAPLDEFLNDPDIGLSLEDQEDFTPAIWSILNIDGSYYAMPSDNAQFGLFYNPKLFDRYNTNHPDEKINYPDSTWTWDDLRSAAVKLSLYDESGKTMQYGVDFTLWAWPFMAFLAQANGQLWDEQQTTTLLNSPAGEEALQLVIDLLPHAASMRAGDLVDSATGPDKLFGSGQTAILLDGSWRAPFLEQAFPDLEFGISPLPSNKTSAVVSGSVLWAVSSHSKNKKLAWQMIKWMSNREQSLRYWQALRVAPPARMSVVLSPEFAQAGPATIYDRTSWLTYAITPNDQTGKMPGFVPVGTYQSDLEDKITAMLLRAVSHNRDKSLKELLENAAESLHSIIDRDRRARGLKAIKR